jgi:hypothetical protein
MEYLGLTLSHYFICLLRQMHEKKQSSYPTKVEIHFVVVVNSHFFKGGGRAFADGGFCRCSYNRTYANTDLGSISILPDFNLKE